MNKAINGKRRALRLGTGIATCISSIVLAQTAVGQALPELANAGGANISTTGNTMTVDALAADKVINWGTFSVAQNNNVNFVSTDGAGGAVATPVTVINRVIGKDVSGTNTFFPSVINGRLTSTSNIAVWLINPSGVMFGPTGSFNGGSLVVSTLDFTSGNGSQVFGAGNKTTALNSRDVVIDAAAALGAVELKLEGGAGNLTSSGSVLLLGEQITVGKSLVAQGDVYIVAASDVRITSQAGSPVGYTFTAGTRLNGAKVLASGNVQGRNIVVAASNGTSTISNLLQVDAGGQLTATIDGGSVKLLTAANPTALETATGANIVSDGRLRTLGVSDDVTVTSNANVSVARIDATGDIVVRSGAGVGDTLTAGTVQAGGNLDLRSTGDMTLGGSAADAIQAGGTVTIRSTGAIGRGAGTLAIRSHTDQSAINGTLFVQATGDVLLGNASLAAGSTGTAALSLLSGTGAISLGSAVASRFSATAATTFDSTGSITANNSAVAGAGTALSISAPGGITLNSARTTGVDQDISLGTTGAFEAVSVTASRNLTIGNSVNFPLSINAGSLTATTGTLTATAADILIGTATAGQSVNLRSDGDVEISTAGTAGNSMPSGNFSVSGLTGTRAGSFTGGVINAKTGAVSILADTQTVTSVRAASNATLNGTAGITLGSADVGGNLLVTTAGAITLGTLNAQSIVADGRVTITSTNNAIGRGSGSTALTIRSNDGDVAPADALAIKGQNAVALGNASLFGGTNGSAPVTVESVTADVALGTARGSSFTGKAATTFTAGGPILADSSAALAGNTISITGLTGLDLQTVRTAGTGENIVLTSNGAISATTLAARNNLTVASLANPAASLTATTMTAQTGSISAFAQGMTLGSANANQALTLRSDGAISLTGSAIAGTNLSVSGLTATRAASFAANVAQATTGNIDIKAATTDVTTTSAGQNVVVNGVDVTLGRVTAGTEPGNGSYTVTATGDVVLGKSANQQQTARGGITINGATISEGATGLQLTSDSDDNGTGALALTSTTGSISLATATLKGGISQTSDISLNSANATTIDKAISANFVSTSGAAFTANLVDAAGNAAITAGSVAATVVKATGDITITSANAVQANTLAAGNNVTVKGPGANYAASLAAIGGVNGTAITATNGAISVKAGAINVASVTSGTSTTLDAQTAGGTIVVGTVGAGTNYTANATGDITLGRAPFQTQAAGGAISITSTGGSIVRGASATNLTLTANRDGIGGGDLLLDAKGVAGAITLDGATLNGGTAAQRTAVTLKSVTDTVLANANSAAFTATARDFTSSGGIVAAGNAAITATRAASINAVETTVTGSDIGITAGSALIGVAKSSGNYTVTTSGAGGVTLGKSAGQTHSAAGAITITATGGGSISRGTDAAGLILAANNDGADGGALMLAADGAIALGGATLNGGTPAQRTAATLIGGGDVTFATANAAAFTATSTTGNVTSTGMVTAAGVAKVTAGNAASINQITTTGAGNGITVESASASLGRVTSAGDYTVTTTTGNVTLGNGAGQTQSAAGSIKITSGEGAINEGATGLTLLSNAAGSGTGTLELTSRTGIGLQGATLKGGPDRQSDVTLVTEGGIQLARVGAASFTSNSAGSFVITGALDAMGDVSIRSFGGITLAKLTAEGSNRDITLFALGTVRADTISATRNVTVNGPASGLAAQFIANSVMAGTGSVNVAAGQTDLGSVTAGLDVIVRGVSAQLGNVTAGRNYQVDVQDDLTLGKAGLRTQSAGGKVQLTSGGKILEGATGLTLTGNSDGMLGETVGLSATQIALGSSTINGGPDRQSLVSVESSGSTTVGKVNAATFAGNGLGSFTATGAITTTNVASILSNGPVAVTTVTATSQPFGSVKINTPGNVTAGSIVAGQTVEIGGFSDSPVGSVTVNTLEGTTGSVLVRAGASDIGAIKSGLDTRILGTTATIGSVTAGGSYTVATTGNVTLGKVPSQRQQAAKGISITSSGGSISEGAAGFVLTSDSGGTGGNALALTATTGAIALANATLNGGPANQSAVTLTSGTTTVIGSANGRSITATNKGFTANRKITSATDITITAAGPMALVQGASAVGAIRLSATDAAIGGAVDARTIDVTNSGSGNLVIGGTAASETGKFVLNRSEAALLRATETLTLGADGSDNVEIKQVEFTVPKTVRVLANGKRIDITGRISFDADTTLKLGGSTDPNSIIRVQTGTGGAGGSIISNGGVLELTAASIVGGTAAFANDLGAISGPGSTAEASRLNLAPGSSLYNNVGGTGEAMIDVGSMKVTFSNFAMFQNTSDASLNLLATGVKLGNGNPQAIALDIKSGSTQPVFAMFGSINGIINAATALLGNPPLAHYDNISASRINGCVIGGGNCQSVQNLTPSLTALDNIRTSIFTVKPDFQVPFDPLVGTNNDALFDDVGSFGLGELPMTPIECSDPNGNCEVQKKGGN